MFCDCGGSEKSRLLRSCSYSCSSAKTAISYSTCLCSPVKMYSHGTSNPLPLTSDRRRVPLILQTILL